MVKRHFKSAAAAPKEYHSSESESEEHEQFSSEKDAESMDSKVSSDDEFTVRKEQKKRKVDNNPGQSQGMAAVLNVLLSKPIPNSVQGDISDSEVLLAPPVGPILAGDRTAERELADEKLEARAKAALRQERLAHAASQRGIERDTEKVLAERRLRRLATRGVVQLFNAIRQQQQQQQVQESALSKPIPEKVQLSKASFLDLLKKGATTKKPQSQSENVAATVATQ